MIYVNSERAGKRVMASVTQYVEQRLKLKVNRQKSAVDRATERTLLGFRFAYRDEEVRVVVSPEALGRARGRIRRLSSRSWGVSMERRIAEINRFTVGWTAYYCFADSPYRFERLDKWLRRRLRQVRWKEWKLAPTRERNLRSLGVQALWARAAPRTDPSVRDYRTALSVNVT